MKKNYPFLLFLYL